MNLEMDYGEIEQVLQEIMGEPVNFGELVSELLDGGNFISFGKWIRLIGEMVIGQLRNHDQTIGYLLLLIVSAAVLSAIAKAFRNRQISDVGFYMIYLLLFLIMMRSFGNCYTLTENVITDLVSFMKALMPAYLMAAAVSAYQTSAVLYYEGFLFVIYYLQKIVSVVLLPAIRGYVLISMLGHLGKEEFLEKGRKGLKKLILWMLKTMIGVSAGFQMIQGMITPAIDEWKQTAISKGISSMGNLGNLVGNASEVLLGSGVLLKNGIGAAAAVSLIGICLVPAVYAGCYALFYQVLAAVSEPVSDARLTKAIDQMGEGIGLLVKLLFTVCTMFLLTLAIVCMTTGGMR